MHFCSDLQIIDKEIEECAGKCQNGGVCQNGDCKCRKGYSGSYCQYKDVDSSPILYYMMVFLVIIVAIAGLFYGAFRIMNQIVSLILLKLILESEIASVRKTATS